MRSDLWTVGTWLFLDLLTGLVFIFMALAIVQAGKSAAAAATPGSIIIELRWDPAVDADIDLWAQEPGGVPVGYRNKVYYSLALLRDDMGHSRTDDSHNYEMIVGSGIRAGEYIVNAQFYASSDGHLPVAVEVDVKIVNSHGVTEITDVHDALQAVGDELTMARFTLDATGNLVGPVTRGQHYLALQQ